jgi:hypothetical protein
MRGSEKPKKKPKGIKSSNIDDQNMAVRGYAVHLRGGALCYIGA